MAALADLARHASVPVPSRPQLVPWIEPVELGDGLLELRAAETFYPLRHPILAAAFRAVGDRLTGTQTADAITTDLPDGIEPTTVVFLLKMLRSNGLLLDGADLEVDDSGSRERLRFLSNFTPDPATVERRLAAATTQIIGPDPLAERVANQLRAAGCGHVVRIQPGDLEGGDRADLIVACADAPTRRQFTMVNAVALREHRPWLRVAGHGRLAWLGPLVLPGETACFACLEAREKANAHGSGELLDLEVGAIGAFAPLDDLLAAHTAAEAARFLGGFAPPATIGHVYELSATSPNTRSHVLLRDPGCSACGALCADFNPERS